MKQQTIFIRLIFFLFFLSFFNNTAISRQADNFQTEILIPLYIPPNTWVTYYDLKNRPNDRKYGSDYSWKPIIDAQNKVNISAVINPSNGPSTNSGDLENYLAAIKNLNQNGVAVYAYIKTGYMGNSNDQTHPYIKNNYTPEKIYELALADLNTYITHYHDQGAILNGIFFDEVDSDIKNLTHYKNLFAEVKKKNPKWKVILNPGVPTNYIQLEAAGDIIVAFENSEVPAKEYDVDWKEQIPINSSTQKYSSIVHSVAKNDVTQAKQILDFAQYLNHGYVYVTDDIMKNPYDDIPSFWNEYVNYIYKRNKRKKELKNNYLVSEAFGNDAKDLAFGNNDTTFFKVAKGAGDQKIYEWSAYNGKWNEKGGTLSQIAIDNNGIPWGIQSNGRIFRWSKSSNNWESIPRAYVKRTNGIGSDPVNAKEISIGADGTVYIIADNPVAGSHVQIPAGFGIFKWSIDDNKWIPTATGGGVKVAVAPNGDLWVLDNKGMLYVSPDNGVYWSLQSEIIGAKEIEIGANGDVYVISNTPVSGRGHLVQKRIYDTDRSIWRWIELNHVGAKKIAVTNYGKLIILQENEKIYRVRSF